MMDINDVEMVTLPSGFKVPVSTHAYDNYYCDFTETQQLTFNNYINAGSYFPQIVQFSIVLSAVLNGRTSLKDILVCSIGTGVTFMLFWFWMRCYKIPFLGLVSSLIGGSVFRLNLHMIALAVVALFVVKDWKVLLFCVIGGVVSSLIRALLFGKLSSVKYVDGVIKYISEFKYKG